MRGAPRHAVARSLFAAEIRGHGGALGLTPQVLYEFVHVVTDLRRFEAPLSMQDALRIARELWDAEDVVRVIPAPDVLPRTLELMQSFRLGRKRILDTALAATLELAGVRRLATFNTVDFEIFPFLDLVPIPSEPEV